MCIAIVKVGILYSRTIILCNNVISSYPGQSQNDKENSPDATKSKRKEAESKVCGNICDICTIYLKHIEEKQLSLSCYSTDKEKAVTDKETVYLSSDLQKVILLSRLPGYKTCLFTSRLITFNMMFAPIGKKSKSHSHKPVGVLWHEAIAGRKRRTLQVHSGRYLLIQLIVIIRIGYFGQILRWPE